MGEDELDYGYGKTKWDSYLREAVRVQFGGDNYHGIVRHVWPEQGIVYLQPSIVGNVSNNGAHVEHRLPTMIPFNGCTVRPIKGGDEELEEFVKSHNAAQGVVEDARDRFKEAKVCDPSAMQTKWDVYLREAVLAKFGGDNYHGFVSRLYSDEEGFPPEQNAVYFQPSVVWNVGGSRFGIVSHLPTMIPFNGCIVIPLRGIEELEVIVKRYNAAKEAQEAGKRQG
jgi:hypothetical protein